MERRDFMHLPAVAFIGLQRCNLGRERGTSPQPSGTVEDRTARWPRICSDLFDSSWASASQRLLVSSRTLIADDMTQVYHSLSYRRLRLYA